MKRILPKSLIGQLLALVAFMLLVAQGINMFLLYQAEQRQGLQQAVSVAIFRIAAEIDRTDPQSVNYGRRSRGPVMRTKPLISSVRPAISSPAIQSNPLPEIHRQAEAIMASMGIEIESIEISQMANVPPELRQNIIKPRGRFGRAGRALIKRMERANRPSKQNFRGYVIVSAELENGQWLSIASAMRDRRMQVLRPLILQTLVTYLILLIPLIYLGRYISKPLKALTKAAENFKPGERDKVLQGGPPDVRKLISAHNDMNEKVNILLNEKDVMLGAIGHDLRTPLAALRVRIESVEDEEEREKMISGIADMDQTLEDILSLARVGRSSESSENTDINALIETVSDEFCDLGHEVTFVRSGRIVANVKPSLIRRALRNVISNAVKYGKNAAISAEIEGNYIQIQIKDNGPGLSEEHLDSMFEPFARVEKSRNRRTGGTGLGLTLARAIMRDQGGEIILQNRAEGGLCAQITLPVQSPAHQHFSSPA